MPTNDEIKRIIELHEQGLSQGQIAKEIGCHKSTINRLLKRLGIECNVAHRDISAKATNAKRVYDRERRLALNDTIFEKLEVWIANCESAKEFKELMISYGIAEDKRDRLDPIISEHETTGIDEMWEALRNGMETVPEGE